MVTPRVFVSIGTPYTEQYIQFQTELESFLRDICKVDPIIIKKNNQSPGNPLIHIRDVMRRCHGVLVVAYERKFLAAGVEKRDAILPDVPTQLNNRIYPTVWNHIESAMAFGSDLPIYIICQRGLVEEGLIQTKVDWYVQPVEIARGSIFQPEISGSIQAWIGQKVFPQAGKPRLLKVFKGELKLSEMTPKEFLGATGTIAAAFALGVGAAHFFPKIFP